MKPSTTCGVLEINKGLITRNHRGSAWAVAALVLAMTPWSVIAQPMNVPTENVAGSCPGPDIDGDGVGDTCDNCPSTPAEARTFSQNVNAPIPDPTSAFTCGTITNGISRTITIPEAGVVSRLRLLVNLQHQAYSDLNITLSHNGTVVTLATQSSTSQERNISDLSGAYIFDDAAPVYLDTAAFNCFLEAKFCTVVFPGTYIGNNPLSAFNGMDLQGDWTLTINDACRQQTGTLNSWSLLPTVSYPDQFDYDYDGVGDVCDNCPNSSFSREGQDQEVVPIPDGLAVCGTFTSELRRTITMADRGRIDFLELAVELDHSKFDDVNIRLEHNGTIVTLLRDDPNGPYITSNLAGTYSFADYTSVTLGEAALDCFLSDCPVIPDGAYTGVESLSAFYGMDARGDWTLSIHDTCRQDVGTLYLWTLNVAVRNPDQTDTDDDGIGDVCDWCAAGARSGDTDADGDFDLWDYQRMAECMQGANNPLLHDCECFDFDGDGDVDLKDARDLALDYQPEPGCRIDGVFYHPGQSDAPPNTCRSCQPLVSRKQWTLANTGAVCRAAAGGCDIAEVCSGSSGACPPDALRPNNYTCRPAVGGCDAAEVCSGVSTACPADAIRPNNFQCRPAAGACDIAETCNGISTACPQDVLRPSWHACVFPRDAAGNYACREVAYCTGSSSTCPTPDLNVYDPTIPCRETGFNNDPTCDPPEYCTGYGQCALPQHVDAKCNGGNRPGEWCDIYEETVLGNPQCGDGGTCVKTVCRQGSGCESPWTCAYSGRCEFNGFAPAGTDCIGDLGCELYRCDAAGNCIDQNVTRSPSARCRPVADECDTADFCGNPANVPSNGRYDFDNYPDCGPDEKKPWATPCTYHPLGENAPGKCSGGECMPYYCKNSIECPDGWVCGCPPGEVCPSPYCVPAPATGGYGDVCAVQGYCSRSPLSWDPGRRCTSNADCSDINHQGICLQSFCDTNSAFPGDGCASDAICRVNNYPAGKCLSEVSGDCGRIPGTTLDYVCCAGMKGDGRGGTPGLGQTGRCQECCDTSIHDACFERSEDLTCCDGKCTDVTTDIYNCAGCNYETGGYDCTELISACSPGVAECDAINIGGGCVMSDYCEAEAEQNGWVASGCDLPQVRVPVPDCDYCVIPSSTPGKPCLTESDCGGFDGITFWCRHDSSLFCYARSTLAYSVTPECTTAPFTGCTRSCYEVGNNPNVGDVCTSDADCHGGTTCKSSCDLSADALSWYLSGYCFDDPTCQW